MCIAGLLGKGELAVEMMDAMGGRHKLTKRESAISRVGKTDSNRREVGMLSGDRNGDTQCTGRGGRGVNGVKPVARACPEGSRGQNLL